MQIAGKKRNAVARASGVFAKLFACLSVVTVALSLLLVPTAFAQTNTADILGTVTDVSGGAIPNAKVTLVNNGTQETRTTQSNDSGNYTFSNLTPGTYKVTVQVTGFTTLTANDVAVAAGDRRRVEAPLTVGATSETVEVNTSAPVLQTDSSVVASTVTERAVQDLPLNGRNFIALAQLSAGATEGSPASFSSGTRPDDRRQGSSVAINGQPDVINNQLIDGLDNNEKIIGTIGVRPSVEAIAEVRVLTNTFTADSGRAAGAVINIITKSGTNNFHGSVFEYFRNDAINAAPYQFGAHNKKPELRQNQFGGSIGGPIFKDKTFFFADLEYLRLVRGSLPSAQSVPSLFEEQNPGNFSDLATACNNGASAAYCVFQQNATNGILTTPATPVAGNIVPAAGRDPVGLFYLGLFPNPNNGCPTGPTSCQYIGSRVGSQFTRLYDIRVDHRFNAKDSIFARYSDNNVNTISVTTPFPVVNTSIGAVDPNSGFAGSSPQQARNAAISYTHVFTEKVLMQAAIAYSYVNNLSQALNPGLNPNAKLGQPNVNTDQNTTGLAPITVSSLSGSMIIGNGGNYVPLNDRDNNFQGNGFVLWNKGNQSIKVGAALIRRYGLELQNNSGEGAWTFTGLPQLTQGIFSAVSSNVDLHPPTLETWEPSVYLQDDYKASPNLTLNLGIRYDVYTPYTEKHNYLSNFDPIAGVIYVANQNGVSRTGNVKTDYRDLAPRVGFAYTAGHGLVMRGGFGLSFVPTNIAAGFAMKAQPNTAVYGTCTSANSATTAGCNPAIVRFANGLPQPLASDPLNPIGSIPSSISVNFRSAYLEQYNLALQKELFGTVFTATYVGSQGRRLLVGIPYNNVIPVNGCALVTGGCAGGTTVTVGTRPLTARGLQTNGTNLSRLTSAVATNASEGASNYNSLQVQAERRFSKGFGFNANYVWAHGLDNRPDPSAFAAGGNALVASTRSIDDYGSGDIDVRNRISALVNYAPQFGNSFTGAKGALLKGYQVNLIEVWSTGTPNNVINTNTGTACGADIFCVSPNGTADRPNQIADYHISNHGPLSFFNTAAFASQTLGTRGSERRNVIYGPHYRHLDASIFKDFHLVERATLQFRAEAFNLANQTNFYFVNANLTIANSQFGKLTNTTPIYTPRSFQFAMKVTF